MSVDPSAEIFEAIAEGVDAVENPLSSRII
jgi:hypothetical protein